MKKSIIILAAGIFFASSMFFLTSNKSDAQEKFTEFSESVLTKKLDDLVHQLSELTKLITKTKEENYQEDALLVASSDKSSPLPVGNATGCSLGNSSEYMLWNSSYYRDDLVSWNISVFPDSDAVSGGANKESFLDLNGDGLVDYFFRSRSYHSNYIELDGDNVVRGGVIERSCVLLNNGHGWDLAYKCVVGQENINADTYHRRLIYYGDCADTSR